MPVFENDAALAASMQRNQIITDQKGRLLSVDEYGKVQYYDSKGTPISATEASLPAYKQSALWKTGEKVLSLGGIADVSLQNAAKDAPYPILEAALDFVVEGATLGLIDPDPRGVGQATKTAMTSVYNRIGLNNVADYETINRGLGRTLYSMPAVAFGYAGPGAISGAAQKFGFSEGASQVIGAVGTAAGKDVFSQLATSGKVKPLQTAIAGTTAAAVEAYKSPTVRNKINSGVESVKNLVSRKRRRDDEDAIETLPVDEDDVVQEPNVRQTDALAAPIDIVSLNSDRQAEYAATVISNQPILGVAANPDGAAALQIVDETANSTMVPSFFPKVDDGQDLDYWNASLVGMPSDDEQFADDVKAALDAIQRHSARAHNGNATASFSQATAFSQIKPEVSAENSQLPRQVNRSIILNQEVRNKFAPKRLRASASQRQGDFASVPEASVERSEVNRITNRAFLTKKGASIGSAPKSARRLSNFSDGEIRTYKKNPAEVEI